jgi:hypothetical protein
MSLLREIQDAAVDGSSDLESLLLKCRVLAARLKHEELMDWVNWELDGYPQGELLPEYRKLHGMCYGHYLGKYGGEIQNCPIPETAIPEGLRDIISYRYFREGVSALKSMAESVSGPSIRFEWPAEAEAMPRNPCKSDLFRKHSELLRRQGITPENYTTSPGKQILKSLLRIRDMKINIRPDHLDPDFDLAEGWICVGKGALAGILSTVRDRILDFAMEIEAWYPNHRF